MPYVYSSLANDQLYTNWAPKNGDDLIGVSSKIGSVLIKGGYGIIKDNGVKGLVTPDGAVINQVSDAEMEILETNEVFKMHVQNGHVTVHQKQAKTEKVSADMNLNDKSKPYTPQDAQSDAVEDHDEKAE